ncbi:MAG TPA: ATP-binding cassette domain-containing protein, partial [Geminicoccaceae bacterium]|nr:ATP-binding cassette domain-containing protein [Geminicoccaceae bacterium]
MALQAPVPDRAPSPGDGGEPSRRPRLVAKAGGLEARGLGKRFKGRMVLRDVDLEVRRGEAVGLLGPNGAGKTTTMRMIMGLATPSAGELTVFGVPAHALSRADR